MRVSYVVSLDLPFSASKTEAASYIRNTVQSWKGGLDPEDPMFELDYKSVTVFRRRREDESMMENPSDPDAP